MTIKVTITHNINSLADLRSFLAEIDRAGLDDTTPLHCKTKLDWSSRHGTRLTRITAGATDT